MLVVWASFLSIKGMARPIETGTLRELREWCEDYGLYPCKGEDKYGLIEKLKEAHRLDLRPVRKIKPLPPSPPGTYHGLRSRNVDTTSTLWLVTYNVGLWDYEDTKNFLFRSREDAISGGLRLYRSFLFKEDEERSEDEVEDFIEEARERLEEGESGYRQDSVFITIEPVELLD